MTKKQKPVLSQQQKIEKAYKDLERNFRHLADFMQRHIEHASQGRGQITFDEIDTIVNMLHQYINFPISDIAKPIDISRLTPKVNQAQPTASQPTQNKQTMPLPDRNYVTSSSGEDIKYESKISTKNRISESQLKNMVIESVKKVLYEMNLNEGFFDKKYRDGASIREYLKWKHRDEGIFVNNNCYSSRDSRGAIELSNGNNVVKLLLPTTEQDIEMAVNRLSGKRQYRSEYDSQRGVGFNPNGRF